MQTGSSATLIGWESGQPLMSLYGTEWRERGYGLCRPTRFGLENREFNDDLLVGWALQAPHNNVTC
jgi:hypothetical protein